MKGQYNEAVNYINDGKIHLNIFGIICAGRTEGTIVNRFGFWTIKEAADTQQHTHKSNTSSIWAQNARSTVDRMHCLRHSVCPAEYVEELDIDVDAAEKHK